MAQVIHVAIAILVRRGEVLVCRRRKGDRFAELWEFPGGKLQPEESAESAMHREVEEELGVEVRIAGRLGSLVHDYGDMKVCLHPFVVALEQGRPVAKCAQELRWVMVERLCELQFPQANTSILAQLPTVLRFLAYL